MSKRQKLFYKGSRPKFLENMKIEYAAMEKKLSGADRLEKMILGTSEDNEEENYDVANAVIDSTIQDAGDENMLYEKKIENSEKKATSVNVVDIASFKPEFKAKKLSKLEKPTNKIDEPKSSKLNSLVDAYISQNNQKKKQKTLSFQDELD